MKSVEGKRSPVQPGLWRAYLAYLIIFALMAHGTMSIIGRSSVNSATLLLFGYSSLILGSLFSVFIHEMGHVIAGCRAGMTFRQVHVGPFCVSRADDKFEVFLSRRTFFGGFAYMSLPEKGEPAKALRACILGGPVATLLLSISLGLVLAITYKSGGALEIMCLGALFYSAVIGVPGCTIPMVTKGVKNDALLLVKLAKAGPEREHVIASFLISKETAAGVRPRNWTRSVIETLLAKPPLEADRLSGLLLAYSYFRDLDEASNWRTYLQQAQEIVNKDGRNFGILADVLWLEAAFVAADSDDDVIEAGLLYSKSTSKAEILDYSRKIVRVAVLVAQGCVAEGDSALRQAEHSLATQRSRTGCNIEYGAEVISRLREKLHHPKL